MIIASRGNELEVSSKEKSLLMKSSNEGVLMVLSDGHRIGIQVHFELNEFAADAMIEFLWRWKKEKCLIQMLTKSTSKPDSP